MSNIWSVRGVSPQLRKRIVEAASQSGLTVAEWLDRVVSPSLARDYPPVEDVVLAIDACLLDLAKLTDLRPDRPPR